MITDKNSQESLLQYHKSNWEQAQLMKRRLASELCPQQKTVMQQSEKTFPLHYIKVVTRHEYDHDHDLNLARDEVMAEVSLPGSAELLQPAPGCLLSQSADPKEETLRLLTLGSDSSIIEYVREKSGEGRAASTAEESESKEVRTGAVEDRVEKKDRILDKELERRKRSQVPDEDREEEGGEGGGEVGQSAQGLQEQGEGGGEVGQSAQGLQEQGEGGVKVGRSAQGLQEQGEGRVEVGQSAQGRQDQGEGGEEVGEPDQDQTLQPLDG